MSTPPTTPSDAVETSPVAEVILRLRAHPWLGDVAALAGVASALALRFWLEPVLPPGFPYLTFFPVVVVTTFLFGLRPGISSAILSGLCAWYFFLAPANSFALNPQTGIALAFYAFIVAVDIALIHFMHVAGERLRRERAVNAGLYEQQRTMFQELQHRVANNMQFVAALLTFQRKKVVADPSEALAVIDDARARLETISRLHRRLYDPSRIAMPVGQYLQELCSDMLDATGARNVVCLVEAPVVTLDLTRLTTLSLLVVEIITNALKHAFGDDARGTIVVRLEQVDASNLSLTVTDNGKGIPEGFDPASSRSLGFRIAQGLAQQLGGELAWSGGPGTEVRLKFPIVTV
ncbi:sensor histidine kinase [Methylobacterium pseudosasicola]|uniref:histidine kinase n=1 Tax=Methylobacterium pseudosasicola TaxID=582667 RepID=A0A1I4PVF8_9HYPH|nr:ATP-binding protein [Methylobacterium pseudosasicola]SFM31450.1 Two-component sensor histidine kinase, contains HisKA and HATPase domains [Methylobacterium pseudosasicola]